MKQTVLYLLLGIAFAVSGAQAQVTIENSVSTDSVDLFAPAKVHQKSTNLALAASLVLPGLGHQYLGRDRSALAYFSAEAVSIFALFFCNHYATKLAVDAGGYAWAHSGAQGPIKDADDPYWKLVGDYMDVQEYNTAMDLNRTPDQKISNENQAWHWDDQSSLDRYNTIRSTARSFRIASTFFIGALVLDRVIAFIDIRTTTRYHGIKSAENFLEKVQPQVNVTHSSVDLSLSGSF